MNSETNINLKHMLKMAESISQSGFVISEKLERFLFCIKNMQEYWQGENYRNFVQQVNNKIETLKEISIYCTEKLPQEIIIKRNMYAKANNEIEEQPCLYTPLLLEKVIIRDQGDTIIYKSSAMEINIDRVIDIFDAIKMNLNKIEDDFQSIIWQDATGILMKQQFEENFVWVQKEIKTIRQESLDSIVDAMEKMEQAEKENAIMETNEKLDFNIQNLKYDLGNNAF